MATGLRLVWCSPPRRASGFPPSAGSLPPPNVIEARTLVEAWVCTPFDSGPEALGDLVTRIAAALASRDLPIAIVAEPVSAADLADSQ
jgi:hypothetical protein